MEQFSELLIRLINARNGCVSFMRLFWMARGWINYLQEGFLNFQP
jgi:hypothetical protein